jgi:pilus assembly protein CpaC
MKLAGCLLGCLAFGGLLAAQVSTGTRDLSVTAGKSVLVESPAVIERVSVANADLAEAVVVTPREVLVNGKAPGETSLIVWQQGGNRLFFDLTVRANTSRIDAVREEMARELGEGGVEIDVQGDSVFLRGTVKDLTAADRAVNIASTLGKPVNLLRVNIPDIDQQVLLKVRFADVDRSAVQQLGINIFSTGATNTIGQTTTGQFSPPSLAAVGGGAPTRFTLTDAMNIFLFRPDLDLGATIRALQTNNLLQMLAEPNVLAINGHAASFLAGGEFPYPTLQGGGGGLGAVTIQFREFGVRINFTPTITPRGTIRLLVTPEVSTLDYANGLVFQGFTIPGLNTRRVQTEIELQDGQSFAIAGLLDNRTTQILNKVPGIGDIPILGLLFKSRNLQKNNTELLVMVTPEIVRPIPAGQPTPELNYPQEFLQPNTTKNPMRTPGVSATGPAAPPPTGTIPVEQLVRSLQPANSAQQQQTPQIQFVPMLTQPGGGPQPMPSPAAPAKPAGGNQQ